LEKTKRLIRACEEENVCLIFDDTIIERPYMDENDIVYRYYDHAEGKTTKGINLLNVFYNSEKAGQNLRLPIDFRIIAKIEEYTDEKRGERRQRNHVD
jgi:hypothetical protein